MSANSDVVIVEAVRTPTGRGREAGALAGVHPVDLLSQTLTALVARTGIDPGTVDDVLIGCVSQVGEQSATPGRMAWLGAGFPAHVPAATIDRKCGSSQQAVHFGTQAILSGQQDIVIVGGVESMSRVRMGSARMGEDAFGESVARQWAPGLVPQGVAADLVAKRWSINRDEQDAYATRSHQLAAKAQSAGSFDREIIPIVTPSGVVSLDETIRPATTVDKLAELQPVFGTAEYSARFPEISWTVTAGNSSQVVDGASAMLLMSRERAEQLNLRPRARIHSMDVVGDDPMMMLTAPIPATARVLKRAGLDLSVVDHIEINEAFASVPLAWLAATGADIDRVNPRGGAIALGHPLGSSGTRLMTTMLHALEDTCGTFGLQVMCEAGGMANATIIERIS